MNKHKELFKKMAKKYTKGKAEHKRGLNNYFPLELAEELLEELIDAVFYVEVLVEKLKKQKEKENETQEK